MFRDVNLISMAVVQVQSVPGTNASTRILRLSGPFTIEGVDAFESVASTMTEPLVIIDLTGVPYMDSCALGALMGLHRPSESHQRQYAVVGPSERLRAIFCITRVDDILVQFGSVEEAEQKLGAKAAGL